MCRLLTSTLKVFLDFCLSQSRATAKGLVAAQTMYPETYAAGGSKATHHMGTFMNDSFIKPNKHVNGHNHYRPLQK